MGDINELAHGLKDSASLKDLRERIGILCDALLEAGREPDAEWVRRFAWQGQG